MAIKDNPTFRDLRNEARTFQIVRKFAPILMILGEKGREAARLLRRDLPALIDQSLEIVTLPDRFNAHFLSRGWIASEYMHYEAMRDAVSLADSGDLDSGEARLVEEMNAEFLQHMLLSMRAVKAFRPREQLLRLALEDHRSVRFHASVPVVLAQIDGIVFDVARSSFFSKRTSSRLYAADTLAGHPDGLAALASKMSEGRKATTQSVLDLPYRHGILHGRDLGYATETNSTKAFAALIALKPWAMKVEAGTAHVDPPLEWLDPDTASWKEVKRLWRDLMRELKELAEVRRESPSAEYEPH